MGSTGEEFVKNLKLKQEKDEIQQRLDEINEMESSYNNQKIQEDLEEQNVQENSSHEHFEQQTPQSNTSELDDIMLQGTSNSQTNEKKKYIVLGIVLLVLFVLTIVVVGIITQNTSQQDNTLIKENEEVPADEVLDTEVEQQYQDLINTKLKEIRQESNESKQVKTEDDLDVEQIKKQTQALPQKQKEPQPVQKQEPKKDPFGLKQKTTQQKVTPKEDTQQNQPKRKQVIQAPKETNFAKTKEIKDFNNKPQGSFIQVGSFTKMPSQNYLQEIENSPYTYTLYRVKIKNTVYTKVLIGPYPSKQVAKNNLSKIQKTFGVPDAYILNF